ACKQFYEEKDYETRLLSVYSYLYDDGNKQEFTAKSVADTGFWIYDGELKDIAIHFIRPCDVNEIDGAEADESEVLKVFSAMPADDGVYISSADYKGGMISYDDYKALIMKYSFDHGEINIPKKDDEMFDKFLSLLRNLTGKEYDVKYMANDEKYGIAVVGEKDDNAAIKSFLFMKKDGEWKVEGKKLEENPALRYSLNQMYPDMELGLLPDYNITDYGKIQSELTKFIDDFKAKGIIHDSDYPVVYSCGTGRFLYIEMSSGKKVLGAVNNQRELETYTVDNVNEAVAYMKSFEDRPPLFILKYY
ncbi:MAG: hypothetical protein IJ736_14260, partial [Firmicutes bacterium]|nr:hypothetical protein [Bacillota bacterium]